MNFFERLSPSYVPPEVAKLGESRVLRERILHTMLLAFDILGLIALLYTARNAYYQGQYDIIAGYTVIYLTVVVLSLFRNLSYGLRSWVTMILMALMGVSRFIIAGSVGEMSMFLVGYVALNALYYDFRYITGSIIASLAIIILVYLYGGANSTFVLPRPLTVMGSDWFTTCINFIMVALTSSAAISLVISEYEGALKKQNEISQSLEYERETIEDRIRERTRNVTRRLSQLRTATDLIRSYLALSDPQQQMREAVEAIREKFDLYYVGLFLIDSLGQNAALQAGTGEAGRRMLAEGHHLPIGGASMIGWTVANQKSRIALDVGSDAVRFSNPFLPLTRSEVSLPMVAQTAKGKKVIGAVSIQSEKPNAFDENDIAVLQTVVDSLATAIENNQDHLSTRQSLEDIRALNRDYLQKSWAESLENYGDLSYTFEDLNAEASGQPGNEIKLPLLLREETLGEIILETDRTTLTAEERAFIDNITNQTAIALENARLLQDTERRAIQEQKLNELTARFSRAMSVEDILRAAAQELSQLPAVAEVSVRLSPAATAAPVTGETGALGGSNGHGKEPSA